MEKAKIFHNPRCSKSRESLGLLRDNGFDPQIVDYLNHPPDKDTLRSILAGLGVRPRDIIRKSEKIYADLGLAEQIDNDELILDAMIAHPKLIERPIVMVGNKITIGRPPSNILEII